MNQDIFFMPLGGGQRVGASCYYLRLGEANILLDAGIGIDNGIIFEPDIRSLLTTPFVQSLNQINQIFISHAHADHVGFLLKLLKSADKPTVYMTEITSLLSEYQLYDKFYMSGEARTETQRLAAKHILDKIVKVSYMQTITYGKYKVTFLPAGHIPGAMMLLFQFGKRRILYTGDYSIAGTALTDGCMIPEHSTVDTVILCGLHAKHPHYQKKTNSLYRTIRYLYRQLDQGNSVMCHISQLSKGIEFLKTLNEWNFDHVPIYIDDSIMPIVTKMEQSAIPILNVYNHVAGGKLPYKPHIYITAKPSYHSYGLYKDIKIDFTLHEDFSEIKQFIKRLNPKQAYIVHCSRAYAASDPTIEQALMLDGECRTQFTFAEEKEIYKL